MASAAALAHLAGGANGPVQEGTVPTVGHPGNRSSTSQALGST